MPLTLDPQAYGVIEHTFALDPRQNASNAVQLHYHKAAPLQDNSAIVLTLTHMLYQLHLLGSC
jgi:hypothetical protein